jgi:hypothetical protein
MCVAYCIRSVHENLSAPGPGFPRIRGPQQAIFARWGEGTGLRPWGGDPDSRTWETAILNKFVILSDPERSDGESKDLLLHACHPERPSAAMGSRRTCISTLVILSDRSESKDLLLFFVIVAGRLHPSRREGPKIAQGETLGMHT